MGRFLGILNSPTNLILTEIEHGNGFEAAVKKAQDLGMVETDPSFDVDGWDAAAKVSALATVLILHLRQVHVWANRSSPPMSPAKVSAGTRRAWHMRRSE